MFTDLFVSYKMFVHNYTVNLQSSSKVLGRLLLPSSNARESLFTDLFVSYKMFVHNYTVNLQSSSKVLGRLLLPSSNARFCNIPTLNWGKTLFFED